MRREAATALGRLGMAEAVPVLLSACATSGDRVLEHALIYALIEIGLPEGLRNGLSSQNSRTRRAALIALDQIQNGGLRASDVAPLLESRDTLLRETAAWIVSHRSDWGAELADGFRLRIRRLGSSEERPQEVREQLTSLAREDTVQKMMLEELLAPSTAPSAREILLRAMAGHDPRDSTSVDRPVPDFEAALEGDMRGKRIGLPKEYRVEGMPAEIEALWHRGAEWLRDAGAEIVDITLPHTRYALPAYYVIAPAEASSNLARYDGVRYGRRAKIGANEGITAMYERTRAEGFGPEVRRRVMIGTYVLSAGYYDAYYLRAQKVRTLIRRDFETAFAQGIDAILTPATPSSAFAIGELAEADPVQMYLNDVFTVTVNLAGLPGAAVPAGLDSAGLPLGLQVIGRPWDEAGMLDVAYALESASGFAAKPEKWW